LDYSKVTYINGETPVEIICPVHGSFFKKPNEFKKNKCGCAKCGFDIRGVGQRWTQDEWIETVGLLHNHKYDYSLVELCQIDLDVKIICPQHGVFLQKPRTHLQSKGCIECGKIVKSEKMTYTTQEFIDKCTIIHNGKYDYSNVCYEHSTRQIEIICNIHGSFYQEAHSHLRGWGCNICAHRNRFSRTGWRESCKGRTSYVYLVHLITPLENCYKIGITINLSERYKGYLREGIQVKEKALMSFENSDDSFNMENHLFRLLKQYKYKPLYTFGGRTECFQNRSEVLSTFNLLSPKG